MKLDRETMIRLHRGEITPKAAFAERAKRERAANRRHGKPAKASRVFTPPPQPTLREQADMAAIAIRASHDNALIADLARHERAIAEGCPCRHAKHWNAIVALSYQIRTADHG